MAQVGARPLLPDIDQWKTPGRRSGIGTPTLEGVEPSKSQRNGSRQDNRRRNSDPLSVHPRTVLT
jgi:hypothetical protein